MASRSRRRRPIPLHSLRGFEAAARHLSFTLAAEEMALTQSSVSRQIAALEQQVGRPLFVRRTRSLALTAAGARLHEAVVQALRTVDRSVDEIRGVDRPPRVGLTTYASFASLWLVPRLAAFQREHPSLEIRIDASDRAVDLLAEGVDVAVRRTTPARLPAGLTAVRLGDEFATPALSPQLCERSQVALNRPADLLRLPLIEMDEHWSADRSGQWTHWFESAGVDAPVPQAGRMTFSFIDQAVQAAVRAQGVVMGRTPLLEDAVAAGQLVTPFPQLRLATGYAYFMLVHPQRAQTAEVSAFTRWLAAEFARGPQRLS